MRNACQLSHVLYCILVVRYTLQTLFCFITHFPVIVQKL